MMEISFDQVKRNDELMQSETACDSYREYLSTELKTITPSFDKEVLGLLQTILMGCPSLTTFQTEILIKLFTAFDVIKREIDPDQLKAFKHLISEDGELILYRRTDIGLTNLVVDSEEGLTYSFISKGNSGDMLEPLEESIDFEKLAYRFFSN
jgi:hypothetical protein